MFENEADRLAEIKALGGQLVVTDTAESLWAIFDNDYLEVLGDPGVETRAPVMQCRTSDVEALAIQKDTEIQFDERTYRVHKHQPDGTGMSLLVLRK